MDHTSAVFAAAVTIYYWWQNVKGIEESSDKALRVMQITSIMVVILFLWGGYSLLVSGAHLPPFPSPPTSSSATMRSGSKGHPYCRYWGCSEFSWHSATPSWP